MKIAYVTSQYPAPSHTFISREVTELRRQGIPVRTFSVRQPGATKHGVQVDNSTYYLLPFRPALYLKAHITTLAADPVQYVRTLGLAMRHRVPGVKAFVWAFFYFLEAMVLAAEFKRRGITHAHNHFANPSATVSMLATRYLRMTWSLTLHGHSETDYPAGVLLGEKLAMCDFAACVSNFGRAQGYRVVDSRHWHKLFINRCALDLSALPAVLPRRSGQLFRVISVARLSPEKGHQGLLEAFASASILVPDCELVLVGDGPEMAALKRSVVQLGIADRVTFKGALPEQETLREIAASDALVLASFIEGLPVVLMEAMAPGKPVIAPHIAGIPDMIRDRENGLLFDAADWDHLTKQMVELLSNTELRATCSVNGRQTIEERFEISQAVQPLIEHFHGVHRK